ncbi:MAG TPA: N-formylglutamate amidohydrolase [Polyangiales bacterium]|nr:N-formylglutamate amidohydrolase [Polyangiales bacterium]
MPLLGPQDPPAFEVLRAQARSPFLLTADHAGRRIPAALGDLGLDEVERQRHIAWDLGIAEVTRALSARLEACAILQTYSRLVIDCNRPPGSPQSIVTISERTTIPGNVDAQDADARVQEVFAPYHDRIAAELAWREREGLPTVLIAMHSYTPRFLDEDRIWQAGVLYGRDTRFALPVLAKLRESGLPIGDNEPYAVSEDSDYTVITHAERPGRMYVELELRQDLIADERGRDAWAARVADALEHALQARA